jgi:AraC-like DNA-binding protein
LQCCTKRSRSALLQATAHRSHAARKSRTESRSITVMELATEHRVDTLASFNTVDGGCRLRWFLKQSELVLPLNTVDVLLRIAHERGVEASGVLVGTSITPEMLSNPDARISVAQLCQAVDNALRSTREPALGLEIGLRMHIGRLGVLGTALMCQTDLRAALQIAVQFNALTSPSWQFELEQYGDRAVLRTTPVVELNRLSFSTEVLFGCMHTIGSFLLGRPMRYLELRFQMPQPAHVERFRALTDAPLIFGAEANEMWFDAALLAQPLAFADALTAQEARIQCETRLSTRNPRDGAVAQVRQVLLASRTRTPNLPEVASKLLISPRQLRRELHARGTSFQLLLDEVRKQRAIEGLVGSTMTMDELASEIGFQDARSLRRRFKLWTGTTPFAYRQAHLAQSHGLPAPENVEQAE